MKQNILREKSYNFSLRIVRLYRYLSSEKNEFVLSKQVLRSGTSIGANIEESIGGASKRDWLAKLTIAYKEARETKYWLRLLRDSGYIKQEHAESIISDCDEICRIIGKIQVTIKQNRNW